MNPSDRLLRQYIAEALDPPRWEAVRDAIAASPDLQARVAMLLASTVELPQRAWQMPPPGAAAPFILAGRSEIGAVLDPSAPAWLEVKFAVPSEQLDHVVVVLEREHGAWRVLFPASSSEVLQAHDLALAEDGLRRLDVTPSEGQERVGVVLVPTAPDFSGADPWVDVRRGVAEGRHPVVTFPV